MLHGARPSFCVRWGVIGVMAREEGGLGAEIERREATSITGVIFVPLVAPPSPLPSEREFMRPELVTPHTCYRSSCLFHHGD